MVKLSYMIISWCIQGDVQWFKTSSHRAVTHILEVELGLVSCVVEFAKAEAQAFRV